MDIMHKMIGNPMHHVVIVFSLFMCVSAHAGDSPANPKRYPLWDGSESVADYARRTGLEPTHTLDLGGGTKLELVLIPAGKFVMGTPEPEKPSVGETMMGISGGIVFVASLVLLIHARKRRKRPQFSLIFTMMIAFMASFGVWGGVRWHESLKHPDSFPNQHPAHAVILPNPFYMGKFTVTLEQYQAVPGGTTGYYKDNKNNPVRGVSWDNAQAYCEKLADQTNQAVRLPTEAEWEYACRAGTHTVYCSGDTEADLNRVAWHSEQSNFMPHPVGQKEPNVFGLYDMHGNVRQWCQDWYAEAYGNSAAENPQGPAQGALRLLRGSSWLDSPFYCEATVRVAVAPGFCDMTIGFRIVLVPAFMTP